MKVLFNLQRGQDSMRQTAGVAAIKLGVSWSTVPTNTLPSSFAFNLMGSYNRARRAYLPCITLGVEQARDLRCCAARQGKSLSIGVLTAPWRFRGRQVSARRVPCIILKGGLTWLVRLYSFRLEFHSSWVDRCTMFASVLFVILPVFAIYPPP
jgi:hypothetical protein